jgi:hypothetical protein
MRRTISSRRASEHRGSALVFSSLVVPVGVIGGLLRESALRDTRLRD